MAAIRKVVIVPAWGQVADSNWYPWLRASFVAKGLEVAVLPTSPTDIPSHVRALSELCPSGPSSDTLYIGHSVGCQGLLRFFNSAKEDAKIGGLVCVAGWMFIEPSTNSPHRSAGLQGFISNSLDKLTPWQTLDYNTERIKAMLSKKPIVLLSRDDPFTIGTFPNPLSLSVPSPDQDENARLWKERIGAEATFFDQGKKHFNEKEYPEFLPILLELL